MASKETSLAVPTSGLARKLTKVAKRAASAETRPVPHWGISEVMALVDAARQRGRGQGHGHGYRGIADRLISLGVSATKSSVERLFKGLLPY